MKELKEHLTKELKEQMSDAFAKIGYYTNIDDMETAEKYMKTFLDMKDQLEELQKA